MHRKTLIGVDEAGLGPVLGPLVVAGIRVDAKNVSHLQELGVKDSKLFGGNERSRAMRKFVWRRTKHLIEDFQVKIIPAAMIDSALTNGTTMYELEVLALTQILNGLKWQAAGTIYLHQLGQTSRTKFLQKMQKYDQCFSSKRFVSRTVYEKDADNKYIPVAMASIAAKVARDALVNRICRLAGEEYVSGYPNLNTAVFLQKYLERHSSLPPDTRRRWDWVPLGKLLCEEAIRASDYATFRPLE